jgi:hypothetical protein
VWDVTLCNLIDVHWPFRGSYSVAHHPLCWWSQQDHMTTHGACHQTTQCHILEDSCLYIYHHKTSNLVEQVSIVVLSESVTSFTLCRVSQELRSLLRDLIPELILSKKMPYTHWSNSQRFRSYEFLKYSK